MKKHTLIPMILVLILTVAVFTGCGCRRQEPVRPATTPTTETTIPATTEAPTIATTLPTEVTTVPSVAATTEPDNLMPDVIGTETDEAVTDETGSSAPAQRNRSRAMG